ncbi:hypothetical protein PvtlMGM1_2435, partial [Prevotella sp. MGM1]
GILKKRKQAYYIDKQSVAEA